MSIERGGLAETLRTIQEKLRGIVVEEELQEKAELVSEINRLKKERGAIILGHNYMEPALYHLVADIVGDSLALAKAAAETKCDPIIFCGVRFMAETAKILNPNKMVLLPTPKGGCSLAESITAEDVRELKRSYPGIPIVGYINTTSEVKAELDVCCTSGNAKQILSSIEGDSVIFIPDEFLARNVARELGKNIITVAAGAIPPLNSSDNIQIIGWSGRCEVHEEFTQYDVKSARMAYPDVVVLAHPECSPEVVEAADFSGSTTEMLTYVRNNAAPRYLLLTECSMADNVKAQFPEREIVGMCRVRCPHMGEITLESTLKSLRENREQIEVAHEIRHRAKRSLDRMLEYLPKQ